MLVRCSQPEMGFFGWRNADDENLLNAIPLACSQNPGYRNKPRSREDGSGSDISSDGGFIIDYRCILWMKTCVEIVTSCKTEALDRG